MNKIKIISMVMLIITFVLILPTEKAEAANNYIYGEGQKSRYSIRLDGPHFNGDVYHVHFYNYNDHLYCMRLDNLKVCDKKNSDRSKVKSWLMEECMNNSSVKRHIKNYNPAIKSKSGIIKGLLTLGAGVLVILATINIFAGPVDDAAAWSLFFATLA